MQKTTDLSQLVKRLNHDQIVRFQHSGKSLDDFLNQEEEEHITEAILVLTRLRLAIPSVTFEW
jgi:hypothetical protein